MHILVTGGAGFIGKNFIHYWQSKYSKDRITNLDNLTYSGVIEEGLNNTQSKNYTFIKGSICNRNLLMKILKNVDLIINFAAETHVDRSIENPDVFVETNVLGTQILIDCARKSGNIRFHHVSTDEVYGTLPLNSKKKFNEKLPYRPNSPYAASKAGADHMVNAYFKTYKLPITISNCSNNYGPFQHPEKMIPKAITRILTNGKIPMMGEGIAIRDWLYVDDHARAIDLIVNKGKIGETYCVGGNNEIELRTLLELICEKMGVKFEEVIEHIPDRLGHDLRYAIDVSKIKKEVDWKPQVGFATGIDKTIEWYKNNQSWWGNLTKDSLY